MDETTIRAYDDAAERLAEHYDSMPPRVEDIERGLKLAGAGREARVVEIGCGSGRDAAEIIKRCAWYQACEPSARLIAIAKSKVPKADIVQADALSYDYPNNIDVIFAFASLLHVDKNGLKQVFDKTVRSLKEGGIFYISLKKKDEYLSFLKKDQHGERVFYFYSPEIVKSIAGGGFTSVYETSQSVNSDDWFTIALKRGK